MQPPHPPLATARPHELQPSLASQDTEGFVGPKERPSCPTPPGAWHSWGRSPRWLQASPVPQEPAGPPCRRHGPQHRPGWALGHPAQHEPPGRRQRHPGSMSVPGVLGTHTHPCQARPPDASLSGPGPVLPTICTLQTSLTHPGPSCGRLQEPLQILRAVDRSPHLGPTPGHVGGFLPMRWNAPPLRPPATHLHWAVPGSD